MVFNFDDMASARGIPTQEARDKFRQQVDQEIAKVAALLTTLQSACNEITPISTLTDEVLSHIFLQYATVAERGTSGRWTRLMRVCKRWRRICVADARLWSYITPDRPRWMPDRNAALPFSQRLQLSAHLPLTCRFNLNINGDNIALPNLATVLTTQSHRVRSLTIIGKESHLTRALEGIGDLPFLRDLEIIPPPFEEEAGRQYTIPAEFMQLNAPHIRSLILVRALAPPFWHLLANLTYLELRNLDGRTTEPLPSFQDVLSIISRSPRLRHLQLFNYWREDADELSAVPITTDTIILAYLDCLDVGGGAAYLAVLFKSLALPPHTSLCFFPHETHDSASIKSLLVPLHRYLHRPGVPIFRSLCIEGEPNNFLRLSAHTTSTCPGLNPMMGITDPDKAHLSIITRPRRHRDMRSTIKKFIHTLPLQPSVKISLNALTLRDEKNCSLKTWTTIGQLVPQLEKVTIGLNGGMVLMMQGLLAAMKRGTKGVSGRRERRLIREVPLDPSSLSIQCCERDDSQQIYSALLQHLTDYRNMETRAKMKGTLWKRLEFTNLRSQMIVNDLIIHWTNLDDVVSELDYDPKPREEKDLDS